MITKLLTFFLTLLAALAFAPALHAQNTSRRIENRYLFVFDTSSEMKKRVPGEEQALNAIFAITLNGQLHNWDSIGAWTFNDKLQMGEFPLEYWQSEESSAIPLDLMGFVKTRHYSKTTTFDQLVRTLDHVVRSSPRLTVIIFCDGEGQVSGTPWDATINATFKEHARDMKKARQPFIIIIRSQFGQYVQSSMGTPSSITLPPFPPLPQPPVVATPKPPPPPTPPPSLIIIGTNSGTKMPVIVPSPVVSPHVPAPVPPATPPPAKTVPPAVSPAPGNPATANPPQATVVPPDETVSAPPTNAIASTAEAAVPPPAPAVVATPPPVAVSEPPVTPVTPWIRQGRWLALGGAGFLFVAIGLGFFLVRPRGRSSQSLITESLKKK